MEVADWAGATAFPRSRSPAGPHRGGEKRRYAGTSHIDVDGLTASARQRDHRGLAERGIEISGFGYYPNPLHADADHRDEVIGHLKKVITAAGVPWACKVVNTFVGGDRTLNVDENWTRAQEIFAPIVNMPKDSGRDAGLRKLPDDLQL
jgi:sugar phosphate isomerase/epimerase